MKTPEIDTDFDQLTKQPEEAVYTLTMLPYMARASRCVTSLFGPNIKKHKETCAKNRKKRKSKRK